MNIFCSLSFIQTSSFFCSCLLVLIQYFQLSTTPMHCSTPTPTQVMPIVMDMSNKVPLLLIFTITITLLLPWMDLSRSAGIGIWSFKRLGRCLKVCPLFHILFLRFYPFFSPVSSRHTHIRFIVLINVLFFTIIHHLVFLSDHALLYIICLISLIKERSSKTNEFIGDAHQQLERAVAQRNLANDFASVAGASLFLLCASLLPLSIFLSCI